MNLTANQLEDFWEFIDKRPQAMRYIINTLLSMHDRLYGLHLSKAQDRVVYGLMMLARNFGRKKNGQVMVDFPMTRQELADIVRTMSGNGRPDTQRAAG